MHADELDIDSGLVRRLLAAQFPKWADLPLERVRSAGTDNAIFRLGDDMAVRLPRIHWAAMDGEKEYGWLGRIAPQVPVAVPVPIAMGLPGEEYPWPWIVVPWLSGEDAFTAPIPDLSDFARGLARFVVALRGVDAAAEPPDGAPRASRGAPLSTRDVPMREAMERTRDLLDVEAVAEAWEAALDAPA